LLDALLSRGGRLSNESLLDALLSRGGRGDDDGGGGEVDAGTPDADAPMKALSAELPVEAEEEEAVELLAEKTAGGLSRGEVDGRCGDNDATESIRHSSKNCTR
jgi:hypothetical protein